MKSKILKNVCITSDKLVCYENNFELHFLYNVCLKSDNFRLLTDSLIIKFSKGFSNIYKLFFSGNIDFVLYDKYRLLSAEGKSLFFDNRIDIAGKDSYFIMKAFVNKSSFILQFNDCHLNLDNNSHIQKYLFKNDVKCLFNGALFVAKTAEFDPKFGIVILYGNVYILDKNNNNIFADKVEIDLNKNIYKIIGVKDGYIKNNVHDLNLTI